MLARKKALNLKIAIQKEEASPTFQNQENPPTDNRYTISEIFPNLFTSGYIKAKDIAYLTANNFTHIINCANGSSVISSMDEVPESMYTEKGINYMKIYLRDDPNSDIISHILKAINFIESSKGNKKVLFHCVYGISRGPTLLCGYVMWKLGLDKEAVLKELKEKRDCIDINFGFNIQLQKWQEFLRDKDKAQIFLLGKGVNYINSMEDGEIKEVFLEIFNKNHERLCNLIKERSGFVESNSDILIRHQGKIYIFLKDDEQQNKYFLKDEIKDFVENLLKYDGINYNNVFINKFFGDKNYGNAQQNVGLEKLFS